MRKEALKNELESEYIKILGGNFSILHKEVEQWNDAVNEMKQDYKETIHTLMPQTCEKRWVNNIGKEVSLYGGNTFLCSLLILLLTYLFLLIHQVATWNGILIQIK